MVFSSVDMLCVTRHINVNTHVCVCDEKLMKKETHDSLESVLQCHV